MIENLPNNRTNYLLIIDDSCTKKFWFCSQCGKCEVENELNKHIIDLFLNSPRKKLSQSEKIKLDNRDRKESIVDYVCVIKRKNTNFPDI